MGRRGRNRDWRDKALAVIEQANPELYAELVEIRSRNPQEYRKRLREAVVQYPSDSAQRLIPNRMAWTAMQHLTDVEEVLARDDIVYALRHSVRRGNFDGRLDELEAAERAGRNRPIVFHMLDEQRRRDARDAIPRPPVPEHSEWLPKKRDGDG